MDFVELARSRYSCRAYLSDEVPDAAVARVMEAMTLAPTACNRQPFRAHVLRTAEYREALLRCYRRTWMVSAPLVIIMVALPERAWISRDGTNLGIVDATIAFDHLVLAATAEGLGTCWIAAFDPQEIRALLHLTPSETPVVMTPLGYAADQPPIKERQPMEALVHFGAR